MIIKKQMIERLQQLMTLDANMNTIDVELEMTLLL